MIRVDIAKNDTPCTGSLISRRHVLTAAHCLATRECSYRRNAVPGNLTVCHNVSHSREPCPEKQTYTVLKIHLIDAFWANNCTERQFDFVVLELDRDVTAGVALCLPTKEVGSLLYESDDWEQSNLYVAGYRDNNDFKKLGREDENVNLKFAYAGPRIRCPSDSDTKLGMICTPWHEAMSAICNGDSGSPLTER